MAQPTLSDEVDLFIIGGGINGAGIARDAAGRGLTVALAEQDDLAGATSSASSKLVHGGLRYLEQYAFRLVREGLAEREVLLGIAPHLVRPLRFVMPHQPGLRPAWMIRIGLFLYDRLGGRSRNLPGSSGLDLSRQLPDSGLLPVFRKGFAYSDCRVDDARLVVVNARDAAVRGAQIMTRTRCVAARREAGRWLVSLLDRHSGARRTLAARILVNAAGPWAGEVAQQAAPSGKRRPLRLVKGSHVVVPPIYRGDHAFLLQNDDGRIIFVIPYEQRFSLIGTTDVALDHGPGPVSISDEEVAYLQRAVGRCFMRSFTPADIVASWAGIRPLYDDGKSDPSAVTRDYVLELDDADGTAPLLSVFGGKITTYRRLAEHALERLQPHLPGLKPAWTASGTLPGGAVGPQGTEAFIESAVARYPGLPAALVRSAARRHGSEIEAVLGDARRPADLGLAFGDELSEREVAYLAEHEWARTADDVMWRRTKTGLRMPAGAAEALRSWLEGRRGGGALSA